MTSSTRRIYRRMASLAALGDKIYFDAIELVRLAPPTPLFCFLKVASA